MTIPLEKRTVKYIHTPNGVDEGGKKVMGVTTPETWKLWKEKYVVLKNFIPQEIINMTLDSWKTVEANPSWDSSILYQETNDITHSSPESSIGKSKAGYCTPWGVSLHRYLRDKLRNVIDMDLVETYSYTRKYERGAYLTSHTDRPSCEISATLCLDYQTDDNKPWKIWLQNDENYLDFNDSKKLIEITQGIPPKRRSKGKSISLEVGDILLYQGPNIPHWRDTLVGDYSYHIFVHFYNRHTQMTNVEKFMFENDRRLGVDESVLTYDGRKNRYALQEEDWAPRKQFHEFQELWENKLPQMGVDRKVFCNAYDNLELLDLDKGKK